MCNRSLTDEKAFAHLLVLESFTDERNLDHDVLVPLRQAFAFGDDFRGGCADDFRADGAVDDLRDLHDKLLEGLSAFGSQRWVGGHPINESHFIGLPDFVRIAAIDENFHNVKFISPEL